MHANTRNILAVSLITFGLSGFTALAQPCEEADRLPSTEGPAGVSCRDGKDNDCDGLIDLDDSNCRSAQLAVRCAIVPLSSRGGGCAGKFRVEYVVSGATPQVLLSAELLALAADGQILESRPVENGDEVFLGIPPNYKPLPRAGLPKIRAELAVLRVTADDGSVVDRAYCSNVPFLQVLEPEARVVAAATGAVTQVIAALAQVDTSTLSVQVDGVDVLDAIGINPARDLPGGPFDGTVVIRGRNVAVNDLIVDNESPEALAANTLTMTLTDLSPGGHVVTVDADPIGPACVIDDVQDTGTVAVFGIEIGSPAGGEITHAVPTSVRGEVRHGRPIVGVTVNGVEQDVSRQVRVPGDGITSADEWVVTIETVVDQTDLTADLAGRTEDVGTFDPGSNRVIVGAVDDRGNQEFLTQIFAVGNVAPPALPSESAVESTDQDPSTESEIANAFVFGVDSLTFDRTFKDFCDENTEEVNEFIRTKLEDYTDEPLYRTRIALDTPTYCDPEITFNLNADNSRLDNLECFATFESGLLTLNIKPQIRAITASVRGECNICFAIGSQHLEGAAVGLDVDLVLNVPALRFSLTDWQNTEPIDPDDEPAVRFLQDSLTTPAVEKAAVVEARVIDFVHGPIYPIIERKVLDVVYGPRFGDAIDAAAGQDDYTVEAVRSLLATFVAGFIKTKVDERTCDVGCNEKKPCDSDADCLCVDPDVPAGTCRSLSTDLAPIKPFLALSSFATTPEGLAVSIKAEFSAEKIDPEVEATPGALLTPATAPAPRQYPGVNTFLAVADDTFNQIFATLVQLGDIKQKCFTPDRGPNTVGDLLPNCDGGAGSATGFCVGLRGGNCEALSTPVDQGICHGVKGDNCLRIPVNPLDPGIEKESCRNAPLSNIHSDMPILYCARADVPPSLWIRDNFDLAGSPIETPDRVETNIRLNDIGIAIVVDRQSDGGDGALPATPDCVTRGTDQNGDCVFAGTCLDLNFPTDVVLENGEEESRLGLRIHGVQRLDRQAGAVCSIGVSLGAIPFLDLSFFDTVVDSMIEYLNKRIPDLLQTDGKSLPLVNPRLIAVRTSEAQSGFDDYVGISTQGPGPEDTCPNGVCDADEACGRRGPGACQQDCGLCKLGDRCENRIECETGLCVANLCAVPNHEFTVGDCDSGCLFAPDCLTGLCSFGLCTTPGSLPALSPCTTGRACRSGSCSGVCEAVCGDGYCDGAEICGNENSVLQCNRDCGLCPDGTLCANDARCESGFCVLGRCGRCQPDSAVCLESEDCCSGVCNVLRCVEPASLQALSPCTTDAACRSGNCRAGLCEAVCGDGFCDGAETCGGHNGALQCNADCRRCPNGTLCLEDDTCSSRICALGVCNDCRHVGSPCGTDSECCSGNCGIITGLCSALK